ncbi:MAG: TIGR00159 family protein [Bryobacterales bacterium]|nr:TIGR00159 family protein [Bryobacterales bacterium]
MALLLLQTVPWQERLGPAAVVDILLFAFLLYNFVMLVRGRRAAQVLAGVLMMVGLYLLSVVAGLHLLRSFLALLLPYTPLALIVIFQSEIRRALIRMGRRRWLGFGGRLQRLESADEILLALRRLRRLSIGALIVLERDTGLRTFTESGVPLDARLSRDLLLAIFRPGGELHDGAAIIQRDKIAAAACFLPLSLNPTLPRSLGTRHRAAIGITEETDCLALVVSEQTGALSVASFGEIEQNVTLRRAAEIMATHFGRRTTSSLLLEEQADTPARSAATRGQGAGGA